MARSSEFRRDTEAMLSFALTWMCYGGGDDADIFERFGIDGPEFYRRVRLIILNFESLSLSAANRTEILGICARRTR